MTRTYEECKILLALKSKGGRPLSFDEIRRACAGNTDSLTVQENKLLTRNILRAIDAFDREGLISIHLTQEGKKISHITVTLKGAQAIISEIP